MRIMTGNLKLEALMRLKMDAWSFCGSELPKGATVNSKLFCCCHILTHVILKKKQDFEIT